MLDGRGKILMCTALAAKERLTMESSGPAFLSAARAAEDMLGREGIGWCVVWRDGMVVGDGDGACRVKLLWRG